MPITKSASKKLRADKKKAEINKAIKTRAVSLVAGFRKAAAAQKLPEVFSALDRAAKKRVFHPRKANRLKARLSKLIAAATKK